MLTRSQLKQRSADALNKLSSDTLFDRFQVTRVGEITGLDNIGVPVWAATRPCSRTISVTAGKSLDSQMARAGAIAESIEYATFENPRGAWQFQNWAALDPRNLWIAKGSMWNKATNIPVEYITQFSNKRPILFPSDLVWLGGRTKSEGIFQRTSNGQAVAGTFEEAFLSGLYECIERDAITIWTQALTEFGRVPPKQSTETLAGPLASAITRLVQANLTLFLFCCTYDIALPVYWAIIIDKDGLPPFAGWGCHITAQVAAERAVLEAIQSRLVYISGARDDIQRRNFDLLRNQDPSDLIRVYSELPEVETIHTKIVDYYPWTEIALVLQAIGTWKERILYKHIYLPFGLHAVKVFVLGLEAPVTPVWQPGRWNEVRNDFLCGSEPVRSESGSAQKRAVAPAGSPR